MTQGVCVLYVVEAETKVIVQYRSPNNVIEPDISTTTNNIHAWFGI